MKTFYFVIVSGKEWDSKPRTWEQADALRERLRNYYPAAPIHLESITVHSDTPGFRESD